MISSNILIQTQGGGIFILNPSSTKKSWSLVSTRSNFVITMPSCVDKVMVLPEIQADGFHPLRIVFKKDSTPLDNGDTTYTCNVGEDSFIHTLLHFKVASNQVAKKGKKGGKGGKKGGK